MKEAIWLQLGAAWGFLAVAIGRLRGAWPQRPARITGTNREFPDRRALPDVLRPALLAVGLLALHGRSGTALVVAGWSFLLGSVIFSGSLYVLSTDRTEVAGRHHPDRAAC